MRTVTVNVGFITNSSSVVHFFDKKLLEHPEVAAFLSKHEITGYVGANLWNRGACESILITDEQKELGQKRMEGFEWGLGNDVKGAKDTFTVIYGDEHWGFAQELCHLIGKVTGKHRSELGSFYDYN